MRLKWIFPWSKITCFHLLPSRLCNGPFAFALYTTAQFTDTFFVKRRKDAKKVAKLESQVPYHEGRYVSFLVLDVRRWASTYFEKQYSGNKEEVEKIKEQIASIWDKARAAAWE